MSQADNGKIICRKHGPYQVQRVDKVIDTDDQALSYKEERYLCRCGESLRKPFCDGSHITEGFRDDLEQTPVMLPIETYSGKEITVRFNPTLCAQAGKCYNNLGTVFQDGETRVLSPDAESAEQVIKTIQMCPSGALTYQIDGLSAEKPSLSPEIRIEKNGPYQVRGGIALDNYNPADRDLNVRYALCRCGQSKHKPFCDSTHRRIGFRDDGMVAIAEIDSVSEELTRVSLRQRELVIVQYNNQLSVFSGVCLHAEALLAEGFIEDNFLTCGRHRWRYDLETGELDGDPRMKLKKLNSVVEQGKLLIALREVVELDVIEDD